MFEKPVLEVEDVRSYDIVRSAIQAAFASPTTDKFLKRIAAERLRVRDFELVLSKGLSVRKRSPPMATSGTSTAARFASSISHPWNMWLRSSGQST